MATTGPSGRNVTLVRQLYALFARRDLPAIVALFDPEATLRQSTDLPWGGTFRGHDGLRRLFEQFTGAVSGTVTIEQYIDAGDSVVAIGATRGTVLGNGRGFDVPLVHVWTIRNGLVVLFESYVENAAFLVALAGTEVKTE